ncbi:hypothetical protein WICMUC_000932 [Wickerhamomyces mucosus]|uniref:Translocation protein SEC62 n=1 Tax=Wickerhamomyces mucosus TaxID=1378264 RepID=A0A9P8PW13_9ASCO|nr:hypothetical protein WICMUC_000932 [Wickerhamomyces mucosus]
MSQQQGQSQTHQTQAQSPSPPPQQQPVDVIALNIASFLRNHKLLKQRQGLLQGNSIDFFRFKRAIRALLSEEYSKKSSNPKNGLPPITNEDHAKAAFILLIKSKLLIPGNKLSSSETRENNLIPKKGLPTFLPLQRAELTPDEYYIWFYKKKSPWDLIIAIGIVIGIFTIILFPLWPFFMRRGVWYLSMAMLGFIALFFVIAIIRLILFGITYFLLSPGIWIFPNLFEDVGFIDSFIPLYEWNYPKVKNSKSKSKPKPKTNVIKNSNAESIPQSTTTTTTSSEKSESNSTKGKVTLEEVEE